MSKILTYLKTKDVTFYLSIAIGIAGLVFSLIYLISNSSDKTYSLVSFITALIGSILLIAAPFFSYWFLKFKYLVIAALFSVSEAFQLTVSLPTLSDVWNGVNFVGGNVNAAILYMAVFGALMVYSIIMTYLKD